MSGLDKNQGKELMYKIKCVDKIRKKETLRIKGGREGWSLERHLLNKCYIFSILIFFPVKIYSCDEYCISLYLNL